MFKNPFSFKGRIRRTEYGISLIIYLVSYFFIFIIGESGFPVIGLAGIPLCWFTWAQGAKRCHDVNRTGVFQIIPFYIFWMLFQKGDEGENDYGYDPKQPIPEIDLSLSYQDPFPPADENQLTD